MPPGHSRESFLSRIALFLCAALVLVVPLARGGVDLTTEVVVLILTGVAAACALSLRPFVSYPTLAFAAVLLWMTFQLLPVPAFTHAISPGAASMFQLSLGEIGLYPATRPFALDVASGHREVAKATACLLAVVASAAFADTLRRRALLVKALGASAVLVAGVTLGAALLGFTPVLVPDIPFVNPNHLAGFLNLTGFVALGQAMQGKGGARTIWAIGFAAVVVVLVSSISRAGIFVFALGALIFAAWGWRRGLLGSRNRLLALAGSIALGIAGGGLLAVTPVLEQLGALRASPTSLKMDLWPVGARLVREFAWTGIGRGAFPTVFQAHRTDLAAVTYTHLENEWLQVLLDLGVPFGLLLLGTMAWIWIRAARRAASLTELGLLVGVLCLAFQCLFDFSTEILAVAIPLSVALGLLTSGTGRIRAPVAVLVTVVTVLSSLGLARQIAFARAEARLASLGASAINGRDAAARVVSERPADYLPHALVGVRLADEGRCREALPWLRRAMLLAPMVPEPHASAGRCLAGVHEAEAIREYGLAASLGHTRALAEAIQIWPSLDILYRIAGETPDGLLALGNAFGAERAREAQVVLTRLWEEFADPRSALPLARLALRNGDLETALRVAREHLRAAPKDLEAYRIAGTALAAGGDLAAARLEIDRGLAVLPGAARLIELQVTWDVKERRFAEARRRTNAIVPRTPRDIAFRHMLRATILNAQSRTPEAILEVEGALVATPDDHGLWMYLAQLRSNAGRNQEAIAALERAAALPGSPAKEIAVRLDRLRRQPPPSTSPPSGANP